MNENIKHIKQKGVCGKVAFANEKFALLYIEKLKATSTRYKTPQSSYLCPKCLLWHLTSLPYKDETKIKGYENTIKKLEEEVRKKQEKIIKLKETLKMKDNEIANKRKRIDSLELRNFELMKFKGLA